jgi:LacI family transcriptional regulator
MSKKKLTSKDIAKNLGISRTVVSFVLNGRSKEMRISDELTQKVLDYVTSHDYKPNHTAKSLRTGRSDTIGLIVADISNPFFARLARYIEIEATKKKYSVIFCSSDEDKKKFSTQLNTLRNRNVDGLILCPPIGSENTLKNLSQQHVPYVIIDRFFENIPANYVTIDNYKSAYQATRQLVKNHCRNIALINVNNELFTMNQRTKGYVDALVDAGLQPNSKLIKQLKFSKSTKDLKQIVTDVIENSADAILFTTNKLGVLGIQIIQGLGRRIPEDISIVSFDDNDAYTLASTPVTAVSQPLEQVSIEAVTILDDLIRKDKPISDFKNIVLDAELILRESCK